jgi:hypothetical protein
MNEWMSIHHWWNDIGRRKLKYSEKASYSVTLSTKKNPTNTNSVIRGERMITNRLSAANIRFAFSSLGLIATKKPTIKQGMYLNNSFCGRTRKV